MFIPAHNHGKRRKPYPPYMALLNAARRETDVGRTDDPPLLRRHAQQMPSRDHNDPDFRRLWYVRYANDFLLGFSGPREQAEQIKLQLQRFLRDSLKLELSHEKTLITHARTEAARFLGYEIVTLNANKKHDHRGRRSINGAPGLKLPVDLIRPKCSRYTRRGKPSRLAPRLQDTDFSIMTQYQAEYRSLVQYYLLAFNVHRLCRLHRVMELSLFRTLANKFKTSVKRIYRKYRKTVEVPHGTQKVLEVIVDRGPKNKPLVARFGGIDSAGRSTPSSTTTPRKYSVFGARWCNVFWLRNASYVVSRRPVRSTTPQAGGLEPTGTGREAALDQADGRAPPQDPGCLSRVSRGHSSRTTEAAPVQSIDHWRAA